MTVIYQQTVGGRRYEVRTAGASLRLYTNGAFHSQFNPNQPVGHTVWDLLMLPALCLETRPRHALVLGIGGGAVFRKFSWLDPQIKLTGIELDPVHIDIARRYFGAEGTFVEADAVEWTARGKRQFDIVMDDLFLDNTASGKEADPVRSIDPDQNWFYQLGRRCTPQGVVIQNHLSASLARRCVATHRKLLGDMFGSCLLFTTAQYENGILACFRDDISTREARQRIDAHLEGRVRPGARPRFEVRQLPLH